MKDEIDWKRRCEELQKEVWRGENRYNTLYIRFVWLSFFLFYVGYLMGGAK